MSVSDYLSAAWTWLRALGPAVIAAALGFLAFMAATSATRNRAEAKKWKDRAIREEEADVADQLGLASVAHDRAKAHGDAAKNQEKKTRDRLNAINSNEQTMADITSRWRKPKRRT